MATLRLDKRTDCWTVRFYWNGKQVQRSCATKRRAEANRTLAAVEDTIHLVKTGRLQMPLGVDPFDWIVSGGKLQSTPERNGDPKDKRFGKVCDAYLEDQQQKQDTTIATERIHIGHLKKILKAATPIEAICLDALKKYRRRRAGEKCRGKPISDATIKKELVTFRQIWAWARENSYVSAQCPLLGEGHRWKIQFEKRNAREKFQTWEQIERKIKRGGLTEDPTKELWEGLYLDQGRVCELLLHVEKHAAYCFVYPMFAFAAYTGARRSEVLRSQIDDFDFEANQVTIRERKRRKDRKGSTRHVPLHPRLKVVMEAWFGKHPGGSFTVSPPKNMPRRKKGLPSANHLTPSQADYHFETTLKGSKWSVVRGFHVFRHSFGSNLIRSGTVSSDAVAKWMGHSTMEMRELYQHVFPQDGVEQISLLS